jgi:hypothetical protein
VTSAQLQECGLATVHYGHTIGAYHLPDQWIEAYEAVDARPQGRPAEKAWHELTSMTTGSGLEAGASALIVGSLQPALAEMMSVFTADVQALGAFAEMAELTAAQAGELLAMGGDVAEAWNRHQQFDSKYVHLRNAWVVLRGREFWHCADPRGVDSLLSEVSNAPDVVPDTWRTLGTWGARGFTAPPWVGSVPHLRLGWIVRNGGRIWAPTAVQQSAAFEQAVPTQAYGATNRGTSSDLVRSGR